MNHNSSEMMDVFIFVCDVARNVYPGHVDEDMVGCINEWITEQDLSPESLEELQEDPELLDEFQSDEMFNQILNKYRAMQLSTRPIRPDEKEEEERKTSASRPRIDFNDSAHTNLEPIDVHRFFTALQDKYNGEFFHTWRNLVLFMDLLQGIQREKPHQFLSISAQRVRQAVRLYVFKETSDYRNDTLILDVERRYCRTASHFIPQLMLSQTTTSLGEGHAQQVGFHAWSQSLPWRLMFLFRLALTRVVHRDPERFPQFCLIFPGKMTEQICAQIRKIKQGVVAHDGFDVYSEPQLDRYVCSIDTVSLSYDNPDECVERLEEMIGECAAEMGQTHINPFMATGIVWFDESEDGRQVDVKLSHCLDSRVVLQEQGASLTELGRLEMQPWASQYWFDWYSFSVGSVSYLRKSPYDDAPVDRVCLGAMGNLMLVNKRESCEVLLRKMQSWTRQPAFVDVARTNGDDLKNEGFDDHFCRLGSMFERMR